MTNNYYDIIIKYKYKIIGIVDTECIRDSRKIKQQLFT